MLSTQMIKLAEISQWKVNPKEDMIFGEYNGYLFTVLEGSKFKAFITPVPGISPDALESIVKFLEDHRKSLRLRNYEFGDNFLCVRMEEGLMPLSSDKMEYMLGQLSGLLDLYEVPDKACVVCGEPAKRRGLYLGLFCHLHQECEDRDMIDFTNPPSGTDTTAAAEDDLPEDDLPEDDGQTDAAEADDGQEGQPVHPS